MYKVWGEKNRKFFFCFLCIKNEFLGVLEVFGFRGRQIRYINSLLINTIITNKKTPPSPSGRTPAGEAYGEAYTGASLSIVSDYMTSREAFSYFTLSISAHMGGGQNLVSVRSSRFSLFAGHHIEGRVRSGSGFF